MKSWRRWVVVGVVVLSGLPGVAQAESDVDILLDTLVQNGTLTPVQAGQVRRQIAETKEARNKQLAKEIVPDSARNVKWSGDMRLREETRERVGDGKDTNRQRIRFRLGMDAKVSDNLKVGARLASGSTADPISTNQTLNTSFNHKTLVLDRAFTEYTPEVAGLNEVKLTGGVIANPFWTLGQLVWDEDLNFDGAAVHLAKEFGPVTLFTNDGMFSLDTDIVRSSALWSTQGGVILKPFTDTEDELLKNFKMTGAVAYHDYMNVTSKASDVTAVTTAGGLKGNSGNLKDLNLLNPNFELASQYRDVPVSTFFDWVHNTGAPSQNDGFQVGVKLGKARVPCDLLKGWEGGYYYERLESDATFGAFSDSDFGNGGTNHTGNVYWLKVAVLKNSVVGLKIFQTTQVKLPKTNANTYQMDWVTKF